MYVKLNTLYEKYIFDIASVAIISFILVWYWWTEEAKYDSRPARCILLFKSFI